MTSSPSPLSSLLSHLSLILFAFIDSLHHDHKQLWAVSPCGASTELPDLTVPPVCGNPSRKYLGLKAFGLFAPTFTVNLLLTEFGAASLTGVRH